MKLLMSVIAFGLVVLVAPGVTRAQYIPPGGNGMHAVPGESEQAGDGGDAGEATPAPPRHQEVIPEDPEFLPFQTVAWMELSDTDGWSGSFEIQRNGRNEWQAVGLITDPNGFVGTVTVDMDTPTDPNEVSDPVLTDVVVSGELVYLYGVVPDDPEISMLLIAPWSGYAEKGFLGNDWLKYLPQAIREQAGALAGKSLDVYEKTFKRLFRMCVQLGKEMCAPRCLKSLDFELEPNGTVHCIPTCCDPVE